MKPLSSPTQAASVCALVTLALLTLPWLNPFTSGPTPTAMPWLFSWACAAGVLFWWALVAQTPAQRLGTVALAWTLAACASAVLGLLQFFDLVRDWAPWVNQPGLGHAFGNLRQRNQFATLCSVGLAALWWWAQQPAAVRVRGAQAVAGALALVLAALLGAASAASGSRTGLLQLVVLATLVAGWNRAYARRYAPAAAPRAARWLLPVALLAYAAAALALPRLAGIDGSVFERLNESSAQCNSRLNLWRNVLFLIAQKPWWGWGWGELNYAHFMAAYDTPWAGLRFCEMLDNAHNLPLHLAVELGVPVAVFFFGVLLVWLWRQAPRRETRPQRQLAWAVLAVIGLHSLLEYPLWYGPFQLAVLLSLWILHAYPAQDGARASAPAAARWRWPAVVAACAIAAVCTVAAWSYWRVSQLYLPAAERAPQYRQQTWTKLHGTWLYHDQVDFAEFAVTPVTPQTAAHLLDLGESLLHFSPEPLVVQKMLDSAHLLGRDAQYAVHARQFEAAFPEAYAAWRTAH